MKLTIEIPDRAAPELLAFLARMMPVTNTLVPELLNPDPAPGHPELPLPGMPVAYESTHDGGRSNRFMKDFMTPANNQLHNFCEMDATFAAIRATGKTQTVQEWCESRIAAADPLKVAMDDPVEATRDDTIRANHMQKRFWIYGPSGCGKTYTARMIASGSDGTWAIVDIDDESQEDKKRDIEKLLKDKEVHTLIITCNEETRFRSFAKLFHRVRISRPVLNII